MTLADAPYGLKKNGQPRKYPQKTPWQHRRTPAWTYPKTHCINGHERTPENNYINRIKGKEYIVCKICREKTLQDYKDRQKAILEREKRMNYHQ